MAACTSDNHTSYNESDAHRGNVRASVQTPQTTQTPNKPRVLTSQSKPSGSAISRSLFGALTRIYLLLGAHHVGKAPTATCFEFHFQLPILLRPVHILLHSNDIRFRCLSASSLFHRFIYIAAYVSFIKVSHTCVAAIVNMLLNLACGGR
jgi:uncharacterized Zn-finger protein